jgi:DNA-binding transcriptional ArsR family regulator
MDAPRRPRSATPAKARGEGPRASGLDELEEVFAAVARYFGLLAEPSRLKILHTICLAEQSVGAVVAATGLGQTNVSRQLTQLHQAGVVSRRKVGNSVCYQVADPVFVEICRTVCVQIAARIDSRAPLRDELLGFAAQHPVYAPPTARRSRSTEPRSKARA